MTKFRFEKLLAIRETERNEKKNAYLTALALVQTEAKELEKCKKELLLNQQETRQLRSLPTLNPDEILQRQRFHNKLLERLKTIQKRLAELTEAAEARRTDLNEAIKEVKILETLKEKTEERRLAEERRRSDKEVDELATQQKLLGQQKARQND